MIIFRELREDGLCRSLFDKFDRRQKARLCKRRENGRRAVCEDPFTYDWDEADYRTLKSTLRTGASSAPPLSTAS